MKKSTISQSLPVYAISTFNNTYERVNAEFTEGKNNFKSNAVAKKKEKYITYDEDGNFVELELDIEFSALPISVIEYMKINYKKSTIEEVSEIIEADGTVFYKIKLKVIELIFDADANFVKSIKN